MEDEIQPRLVRNTAGPLVSDDTAVDTKQPYVAPRLVVFGPLKALTLANQLNLGTDNDGYQS